MENKQQTLPDWQMIREDWESGMRNITCAQKHGISVSTLYRHRIQGSWQRGGVSGLEAQRRAVQTLCTALEEAYKAGDQASISRLASALSMAAGRLTSAHELADKTKTSADDDGHDAPDDMRGALREKISQLLAQDDDASEA